MESRIKQEFSKVPCFLHINMDMNECISVILDVFVRYPPYSLVVLSSEKFKAKIFDHCS